MIRGDSSSNNELARLRPWDLDPHEEGDVNQDRDWNAPFGGRQRHIRDYF
jgi:hypothetical protein